MVTRYDIPALESLLTAELTDVRGEIEGVSLTGGAATAPPAGKMLATRGTTNRNERGNTVERRRRREWLVRTYRADVDVRVIELYHGPIVVGVNPGDGEPACRCYRCGLLLTADTVSVDRIIPGAHGGTYRRDNIRPACGPCNSRTGAALGNERKRAKGGSR